jgi:hypothetical protein
MAHHQMSMARAHRALRALVSAARHAPTDLTGASPGRRDRDAQMRAGLDVSGGARASSTTTSASGAGPMGRRP